MIHKLSLIIFLILFLCSQAFGATLVWDAPINSQVTGYNIYYSITQGSYAVRINVGNLTSYPIDNFNLEENKTYYFVVTAYNETQESDFSNVVSYTVPDVTPPAPPTNVRIDKITYY